MQTKVTAKQYYNSRLGQGGGQTDRRVLCRALAVAELRRKHSGEVVCIGKGLLRHVVEGDRDTWRLV